MEFKDDDAFEAWLKTQSREVCVAIACRAASRVYPLVGADRFWEAGDKAQRQKETLVLLTGWSILISGVAGTMPTPEIKAASHASSSSAASAAASRARAAASHASSSSAASAAASHARAAASHAASRAQSAFAASAVTFATSAASHAREGSHADADFSAAHMLKAPLWHGEAPPEGLRTGDLGPGLLTDDPRFDFFRRWYDGMLRGVPLDWELQRRVALIPQDVWESGADKVADAIAEIERDWLAEQGHQAEEVYADPEDGLYAVRATILDADAMLATLLAQLERYLDRAVRRHNVSGFSEMCVAYEILQDILQYCRDEPSSVLTNLGIARKTIQANLSKGTYQSEDALDALVAFVQTFETRLKADHPAVREAHERFVQQVLRDIDDDKRIAIASGFRDMGEHIAKDRLAAEYQTHAKVLESDSGIEAQADAVKVSGGRTGKIAADLSNRIKTADGSAANKAAGMLMRAQKLVELLSALF